MEETHLKREKPLLSITLPQEREDNVWKWMGRSTVMLVSKKDTHYPSLSFGLYIDDWKQVVYEFTQKGVAILLFIHVDDVDLLACPRRYLVVIDIVCSHNGLLSMSERQSSYIRNYLLLFSALWILNAYEGPNQIILSVTYGSTIIHLLKSTKSSICSKHDNLITTIEKDIVVLKRRK